MGFMSRLKSFSRQTVKMSNKKGRMGVILVAFFVAMLAILSIHFVPERSTWEAGQVSASDVQSNRYLNFLDEEETAAKQEEALKDFEASYKIDLEKFNTITIAGIGNYFAILEGILQEPYTTNGDEDADTIYQQERTAKINKLKESFSFLLPTSQWTEIAQLNESQAATLYDYAVDISTEVMGKGVTSENLIYAQQKIISEVEVESQLSNGEKAFVKEVLSRVSYQATSVYDAETTQVKREEILSYVEPVKIVVQKGELVVGKGEILTDKQIKILYMLGYTNDASPILIILGLAVLVLVVMYIGKSYLQNFAKNVYDDERQLVLLLLLVLVTVGTYKLILSLNLSPMAEKAEQVGYLIPVAMGTMLVAVLLDAKLAIMVNLILSAFVGLYTNSIVFMVVALASGLVGIVGVSGLSQRSDLSKTAVGIAAVNSITIVALGLLNNQSLEIIFIGVLFGVANGFLSSILTIGMLPYLENMFGITTSIKLLELANPNQPLLKKLLNEAPGTYHHSVMVGNLGEAAAEAINANGLVVRIGAYYHDIGKIKRPYFFSENQFSAENPHDKITPQLSTLILTSHVKDGIEMAQDAGLPPIIVAMIGQHHGNGLVGYFYHKAVESGEDIREEDFRYDQMKPQTKEAAILMMADTVEAAVRSKTNATPGQIEGFIRTLIKNKLNDGQFDECDLTFKDLDKIATAFVRVVNGIYHKRVEYPDQKLMQQKGKGEKS